jgi:hypothetical protein
MQQQTIPYALNQPSLPDRLMLDTGEFGQQATTLATELHDIACRHHISPFAHADRKTERRLREGAIGIDELEACRGARGRERIPFMGVAMHEHRLRWIKSSPLPPGIR